MTSGVSILIALSLLSSASASWTLTQSGASNSKKPYCYAYLKNTGGEYCWLVHGNGEFVKPGDGGYPCSSYDGYSSKYCQNEKKSCPRVCMKSGGIKPGSKGNGGIALVNGVCTQYASKPYGGTRYCGKKKAYWTGDYTHCHAYVSSCLTSGGGSPAPAPGPSPALPSSASNMYAGWGLPWVVAHNKYKKFSPLAKLVCKYYGTGHWGWGSGGGLYTINCAGKKVKMKKAGGAWTIVGGVPGGGAAKPAPPQSASTLNAFVHKWLLTTMGKPIQRIGETDPNRLECWDLAARAVDEANLHGYNIPGYGKSGGLTHWIWSDDAVVTCQNGRCTGEPNNVKAGMVVQLELYKQKKGYSASYTGWKHTAVVVSDYDPSSCSFGVYEQNPKPVHKGTYRLCTDYGWTITGKLIVYQLKSEGGSPWVLKYDADAPDFNTPDDHDDEEVLQRTTPMVLLATMAATAMAVSGFVGCRLYSNRKRAGRDREMYVTTEADEDHDEGVE